MFNQSAGTLISMSNYEYEMACCFPVSEIRVRGMGILNGGCHVLRARPSWLLELLNFYEPDKKLYQVNYRALEVVMEKVSSNGVYGY